MYKDTTHEPVSFKTTHATQSLYFCQLNDKRGVNFPEHNIFYKFILPLLNFENGQVPCLTTYSNQQCIMILTMAFTATIVALCERQAVITHEKLFTFIATYKQLKHSTKISIS